MMNPPPTKNSPLPNHLLPYAVKPEALFVAGQGAYLSDSDGARYLDFIGGWACNALGHSPKALVDALSKQSADLINCGPGFYNEPGMRFAGKLAELSGLPWVYFCSIGAEANENAVKLARKYGQKKRGGAYEILSLERRFHGRTLAMMAATGKPQWKDLFPPPVPGFTHCRAHDLNALEEKISDKTVAVMLELIQGEGGVYPAPLDYVRGVKELCEQQGLLFIVDEVQTGMGRTGKWFCFEHYGIVPDIVTLGKGIGGGYPLAAMLASEELNIFEPGDTGGTYGGQPLACAVGLAVAEEIERENLLQNASAMGEKIRQALLALEEPIRISHLRGKGLMLGFEVGVDAKKLVQQCFELGLIINAPGANTIRLIPPLIIGEAEIAEFIQKFRRAYLAVLG